MAKNLLGKAESQGTWTGGQSLHCNVSWAHRSGLGNREDKIPSTHFLRNVVKMVLPGIIKKKGFSPQMGENSSSEKWTQPWTYLERPVKKESLQKDQEHKSSNQSTELHVGKTYYVFGVKPRSRLWWAEWGTCHRYKKTKSVSTDFSFWLRLQYGWAQCC